MIETMSRLDPADVDAMALAMAAAVDARLRGEGQPVVEPAPPPKVGRGLKEEEIFNLLRALGEDLRPYDEISREFGLSPKEVHRWCNLFMKDFYRRGWPRIRQKIDASKTLFASGIDLHDYNANGERLHTPVWRRSWRALWFLMRFYDSPSKCAAEWRADDPLGLFGPLRVRPTL